MTKQNLASQEKTRKKSGDNRSLLITAAYKLLAQQGYKATTVKEIARVADVSPGLFHYYFDSKEQLLLEVIREASDQYKRTMAQLRDEVPRQNLTEAALARTKERVAREPEWFRLCYELYALGMRNPGLLPAAGELLERKRNGIAKMLQAIAGESSEDGQSSWDALAALLLACFDGLALQKLTQPDFDLDAAFQLLYELVEPRLKSNEG